MQEKREKVSVHLICNQHANIIIQVKVLPKVHGTGERNGCDGKRCIRCCQKCMELVKGMGVMVKGASLAASLTRCKCQPTRLLRLLMNELFTEDELRCSTVRGMRSDYPALDQDTMNAILC